jgi:hypothetical protein
MVVKMVVKFNDCMSLKFALIVIMERICQSRKFQVALTYGEENFLPAQFVQCFHHR